MKTSAEMEPMKHSVRFRATMVADSPVSNHTSMASPENLHDLDSEWIATDGYVEPKYQSLTEKGIRLLCSELLELKKASAEEMQKNVYANYTAFIRTSQELGELELELTTMQTLISTHAVLVRDLLEGVHLQSTPNAMGVTGSHNPSKQEEERKPMELEKRFHILSDAFDVCLAEQRVDEAVATLDEAEMLVSEAHREDIDVTTAPCFSSAFSERKARLVAQLVKAAWQPTVHGYELRKVVSLLNKLGDGPHAHTLLLKSYHIRIQNDVKSLRPSCSWYVGAYVTNLAQLYFSMILQASHDTLKIFGNAPACASELVVWACKETEEYVSLVRKHISSLPVMACGIGAIADFVQISLGYCALLEKQGLSLCPVMLKSLKPCVEGVLDKCLRRIEEGIMVHGASDNWVLTEAAVLSVSRGQRAMIAPSYVKLSISAHKLNLMVQDLLEDVTPIMTTQFGRLLLEGVLNVFGFYVKLLMKALPHLNEEGKIIHMDDGMKLVSAKSEAQQLAILGNAAALADDLLPSSVLKWHESARARKDPHKHGQDRAAVSGIQLLEQKDWRRRLQRAVDELRDTICEQHILELLFDENEKPLLTADLYLSLHDDEKPHSWHQDSMPSAPFQALLNKFQGLEQVAKEVLAGRERVVVLLFMRLTEAFVMWLSKDEYFWGSMEDGAKTFGPIGLHQFVFDMQFVIQIASTGRYASRKMRQTVSAMISRAEDAFSASGLDPKSVLQDDKWFEDNAKRMLYKILADIANSTPDEQEPGDVTLESGTLSEEGSL